MCRRSRCIGLRGSGDNISFFLQDWELAKVALTCHMALDILCQEMYEVEKETWLVGPADFLPFGFSCSVYTLCLFGMNVGFHTCLGVCRLSCFNALTQVQHACREVLSNWFGNNFSVDFFKPETFQHW